MCASRPIFPQNWSLKNAGTIHFMFKCMGWGHLKELGRLVQYFGLLFRQLVVSQSMGRKISIQIV
jgi:hypothetical protein